MSRSRRWLAGFLVMMFTAVEVFASAPQMHPHSQVLDFKVASGQHAGFALQTERREAPADCLACRTFGLASVLVFRSGITPPLEHHTLPQASPAARAVLDLLDDARGRAPPRA